MEESLYLLTTLLKGNGFEVVQAANGSDALKKLRTNSFDMIIADILMPVMDGFQLCRNVKGDDELKHIPFAFYTATYTDEKDEELALKLGADIFIRKPVDPSEFIKIIKGVIRDFEEEKRGGKKPAPEEEKEVFKLYSERLVNKLEKKMLDLAREVAERKRAEEKIKAALREKEILLREIHHRVRNNMQVMISLLKLQKRRLKDEKAIQAIKESQNRIQAMVIVNELLYASESLSSIDLDRYITRLTDNLLQAYNSKSKISLKVDAKDVSLGIDQAVPCGLVINELYTNSLKHAFPEAQAGEIEIKVRLIGDDIELVISDNGQGMPKDFDRRNSDTLGFGLVSGLIESQLGGAWDFKSEAGTQHTIRFKRKNGPVLPGD